ncbi:MAG: GNAT family N-acetyltransferase [Candidatus Zixiibacteriota bacterium]
MDIVKIHTENDFTKEVTREKFVDFMFGALEQWGDERQAIEKSIDYAFNDSEGMGGFLLAAVIDGEVVGGLIMNNTGMAEYIPEHIIVYVASSPNHRGQGIGYNLVKTGIEEADTDVKLHVEYENPAKGFYERFGFTTKYAEMRYTKK